MSLQAKIVKRLLRFQFSGWSQGSISAELNLSFDSIESSSDVFLAALTVCRLGHRGNHLSMNLR